MNEHFPYDHLEPYERIAGLKNDIKVVAQAMRDKELSDLVSYDYDCIRSLIRASEELIRLTEAHPAPATDGAMLEDMKFILSIADEEYDYQMGNVGAECALRHIINRAKQALSRNGGGIE